MQELICFSAFLYHYIDSSVFLEVARREGAIALPSSPKSATAKIKDVQHLPALGCNDHACVMVQVPQYQLSKI